MMCTDDPNKMSPLWILLIFATMAESARKINPHPCFLKYGPGSMVRNNCPSVWDKYLDFVMRPYVMVPNMRQPQHYSTECIAQGKKR